MLWAFILLLYQTTRRHIPENSALHTYVALNSTCFKSKHRRYLRGTDALSLVLKTEGNPAPSLTHTHTTKDTKLNIAMERRQRLTTISCHNHIF
jgi:hypothetical protein